MLQPRKDVLSSAARATGLITAYDILPDGSEQARGEIATAVAIGKRFVLTNKHVVVEGNIGYLNAAANMWMMWPNLSFKIEFPLEYGHCASVTQTRTARIKAIRYVDPILDFAILETDSDVPSAVSFSGDLEAEPGDRVIVIGYPSRPDDTSTPLTPAEIDQVFRAPNGRTPFPAERMAAGAVFRITTAPEGYFAHDASTWGGNSGSIVVDLATGTAIGLHAKGLESRQMGQAYNLAISGSRIVAALKSLSL